MRLTIFLLAFALPAGNPSAQAWGRGHGLIRAWALERIPEWQREILGEQALTRLATDYTSLQDQHAGGRAPHLDLYCRPPGARLSLHDANPPEPSIAGKRWYLDQIAECLVAGETDEAMKFLGVLCHWHEDPGCPSAHSSPVSEFDLRVLLPPSPDKANLNYLYGAGGIADRGRYEIPAQDYRPRLLARDPMEAAVVLHRCQRHIERQAAAKIVPLVTAVLAENDEAADAVRADAALRNARHVADLIHTVLSIALDRVDPVEAATMGDSVALDEWLPEFRGGRTSHPYYVAPFLQGQTMAADRSLHPLAFSGDAEAPVRGYGMGAPFLLEFAIGPGGLYERFSCRVGLHPIAGSEGSVEFIVEVGGEAAATSGPMKSGDPPRKLEVALPDGGFLTVGLRTVAGEDSEPTHNLVVWGEPALHRSRETGTRPNPD